MWHAIKRHGFGQARVNIAAAVPLPLAVSVLTAPPYGERVAITLLLPRLLGGKPRGVCHARGQHLGCWFAQHGVSFSSIPSPLEGEGGEGGVVIARSGSDEAIQSSTSTWIASRHFAALAMTQTISFSQRISAPELCHATLRSRHHRT